MKKFKNLKIIKMRHFVWLLLLAFFVQCKDDNKSIKENTLTEKKIKTQEVDDFKQQEKIYKNHFEFKNDTIIQELFFDEPREGKISFKAVMNEIVNSRNEQIEGIAILLETSDGETDVDDEGEGYFVDEYQCIINNCSIILRIDSDESRRARIKVVNCKDNNILQKFSTVGIMNSK